MKNIKLILIGIAILFVASSVVLNNIQSKKIKAQKEEIARVQENNINLMGENRISTTLVLRKDEINGKLKTTIDSLSKALRIKPKQITKIVTETITQIDTVRKLVYVNSIAKDHWFISDTLKCGLYEADAYLKGNDLKVWRSRYEDKDEISNTFYKERSHKIWFIKYGKWIYKQHIDSKCHDVMVKEIQFIK